jgi:hypothetical protein
MGVMDCTMTNCNFNNLKYSMHKTHTRFCVHFGLLVHVCVYACIQACVQIFFFCRVINYSPHGHHVDYIENSYKT